MCASLAAAAIIDRGGGDAKAAQWIPPVERRCVLAWKMVTRTRRRRRGRTMDDAFRDGDVLGREVGRRWKGGRVSDVSDDNAGGEHRSDDQRRDAQVFQRPPSEPGERR